MKIRGTVSNDRLDLDKCYSDNVPEQHSRGKLEFGWTFTHRSQD